MPYADPVRQREYQRVWMAERRARYLAGQVCIDCGSNGLLGIDHADPDAKLDHRIWSWAVERLEAELAKCVTRCVSCHQTRHGKERRKHGIKRYQMGCRCETCRAAKRASNERYLAKRRGPDSNGRSGLCRPVPNHSATAPGDRHGTAQEAAA